MKNITLILLAVVILAGGTYAVLRSNPERTNESQQSQYSTYSNSELGLELDYRTAPDGYVLQELTPSDSRNELMRMLVLARAEDVENIPVDGEGPPTITIQVLKNLKKQQPQAWADTHHQYSSINLKGSDVRETVVGGANAVRYMADGLYASDTTVVAHGDNMYVISGMFINEDSAIRRDYQPLLDSVRFIPAPGQE
jgi:hypothetical protein